LRGGLTPLTIKSEARFGLASRLVFQCGGVPADSGAGGLLSRAGHGNRHRFTLVTSEQSEKTEKGKTLTESFAVNVRAAHGFMSMGRGGSDLRKLCANLGIPLTGYAATVGFGRSAQRIGKSMVTVAKKSCDDALIAEILATFKADAAPPPANAAVTTAAVTTTAAAAAVPSAAHAAPARDDDDGAESQESLAKTDVSHVGSSDDGVNTEKSDESGSEPSNGGDDDDDDDDGDDVFVRLEIPEDVEATSSSSSGRSHNSRGGKSGG